MKVNVPDINLPRVVVIGGGFGGINLAQSLKDQPVQVVMFDKNNYHTFQPLLYQVATGGLEPDSIAFPLRKLFKRYENFHFRMAEVQRIDPEIRTVFTSIGSITYDYLVIATGSRTNFFGNAQIERHCLGMKDIPEALDLRSLILQNFEAALLTPDLEKREALMNFVVVGAGPTGVETAGALGELKNHILPADYPELDIRRMHIHLIEAGPAVLASMSEEASKNAAQALKKLDVNLWLDTKVESFDGETVTTSTGKILPSSTVIWSAGIIGNGIEGVLHAAGRGGRLRVNEYNQVEGYTNVFAIGDVCLMLTDENYPQGHPQVAPAAIQQARLLSRNILSMIFGRPQKPFKYFDKGSMATIGRNKAVVDVKNIRLSGSIAWLAWMLVHLMYLAGFRNKLVVFINWFWSYLTYDKGTRLIIRPFKRKAVETKKPEAELVS
ncbi:MAG: NAD(P)/FAD-dependent oxidoreductase [Bacteroidia bacterium]|nr:NAD(P)/FAD-dependent oxidoreductase [Bacteroidia bacterium]